MGNSEKEVPHTDTALFLVEDVEQSHANLLMPSGRDRCSASPQGKRTEMSQHARLTAAGDVNFVHHPSFILSVSRVQWLVFVGRRTS